MSISALFGARVLVKPNTCSCSSSLGIITTVAPSKVIECSSRPQKKATAHHMKTRPRKSQPWDIKRRPTVYAPLPPLPPDWTLLSTTTETTDSVVSQPPPLE